MNKDDRELGGALLWLSILLSVIGTMFLWQVFEPLAMVSGLFAMYYCGFVGRIISYMSVVASVIFFIIGVLFL